MFFNGNKVRNCSKINHVRIVCGPRRINAGIKPYNKMNR